MVKTWRTKLFPPLGEFFQHVWNREHNFIAHLGEENLLTAESSVAFTLPPYTCMTVNDPSILQCLGFDVFNDAFDPNSLVLLTGGLYGFANVSQHSKTFHSTRSIVNAKIEGLREAAIKARALLSPEQLAGTPKISQVDTR